MVTTKKWVACLRVLCLATLGMVLLGGCMPPGPRALLKGDRLMREGQYSQAIAELKFATQLLPRDARAWNHLGLAYHKAGQLTAAAEAYQRALACDRNLAAARFNLGCLYSRQGRWPVAISELTTYTLLRPQSLSGWLQLGVAQMRAREFTAAERTLNQVRRLDPRNVEALNDLGVILLRRNRPREAYRYFIAAVQEQPHYAPAVLNLAVVAQDLAAVAQHPSRERAFALEQYRNYLAFDPRPTNWAAVNQVAAGLAQELHPPPAAVRPAEVAAPVVSHSVSNPAPAVTQVASTRPPRPVPPAHGAPKPAPQTPKPTPPPPATAVQAKAVETPQGKPAQSAQAKPTEAGHPSPSPPPATSRTTPPPEPAVEVVRLSGEPPIKPPVEVKQRLPQPSTVSTDVAPAARSVSSAPATNEFNPPSRIIPVPERSGLFARLNPLHWFHRRGKKRVEQPAPSPPTRAPTPAPAVDGPTSAAAAAAPSRPPAPTLARYAYQRPSKPQPGNAVDADRDIARGVAAQTEGRLADALEAYQEAVRADPASFAAQYNLGLAAYEAGQLGRSLAAYETALAIRPDSVDARYNFALALGKANYPADAADQLEELLAAHPEETRAHLALANLYARVLFEPGRARAHYRKVLELDPHHPQAVAIRMWLAANPP
jgi:tetratricopeptide (TPR) repeat protein